MEITEMLKGIYESLQTETLERIQAALTAEFPEIIERNTCNPIALIIPDIITAELERR